MSMKVHPIVSLMVSIAMLFGFGTVALAQTAQTYTPNVQVAGIGIVDGTVTMVRTTIDGPGWVVIHADVDGAPGPVIGYASIDEGVTRNVVVDVEPEAATPILHAMLHVDAGTVGTYEFPGPDEPVMIEGNIVMARFSSTAVIDEEAAKGGPATMPTTGAGTSTSLIFALMAVVLLVLGAGAVVARRHI
jgi:hypothetical protein